MITMKLKVFLIYFAISVCTVKPAKILGIFSTPATSHFTLGFRLMKELADRGHEVTMVSPFPQMKAIGNYTDVPVESMSDALNDLRAQFYNRETMGLTESVRFIHIMAYKLTEKLLSHENFQNLLKSQSKYDLIVSEYFLNEAVLGVGRILKAPVVLFSTLPSSALTNHLFANPAPSSHVPFILSEFTGHMNFWQRFINLVYNSYDTLYKQYYMLPLHDLLLKTYISKELNIENVMYDASLILLNSHPSVSEPVPHNPNMIEIGGFHVGLPEKLSIELQTFMDAANEGVVLFSMGSNLKSSDLDQGKREAIIKAFSKIKQKILWKFEDSNIPGLPDNVKLVQWLPQQQILGHRNTKAFITHGGMLSSIEAVYYGVPVIGIPIYGDQKMNIAKAVENDYAVSVSIRELTKEALSWALSEILNNPKYTKNAKIRSEIMKDQPISPLDSGVYWIEYVIRHKGARHLRSAGVSLKWYKRSLLDIIVVLVIIDIVLFLIFYYIFKHIIHNLIKKIKGVGNKKYEKLR